MKPYEIFIPLNFILSLSTATCAIGVRFRKDKHDGFCSDPWGADWYVPWFISSILYTLGLLYAFLRNKTYDIELGDIHGSMFVFTLVPTFVLFVLGFCYFTKPDNTCDSLQVFDIILWVVGLVGLIVLRMRYPNRVTKAVMPQIFPIQQGGKVTGAVGFKNLRY